jgi:hypothetical protein
MERYLNIDGDSGVSGYEIGVDFIRVQFSSGSIYLYTYVSAGQDKIEQMKVLAQTGNGLNAFINTHARKSYVR